MCKSALMLLQSICCHIKSDKNWGAKKKGVCTKTVKSNQKNFTKIQTALPSPHNNTTKNKLFQSLQTRKPVGATYHRGFFSYMLTLQQ